MGTPEPTVEQGLSNFSTQETSPHDTGQSTEGTTTTPLGESFLATLVGVQWCTLAVKFMAGDA